MKKYKVTLTTEERKALQELVTAGKASSKKVLQARILLKADASPRGPAWTDGRIADALEVSTRTIERLRERFVEQGLDAALGRKPQDRPSRERTLNGKAEARLIALACSAPPAGRTRWTLRLLADQLIELEIVDTVSTETVRRVLKKTNLSRG
jgi:transposase